MTKINENLIDGFVKDNKLIGKLMTAFDKGERTIQNYFETNNVLLTTKIALGIIEDHTGLTEAEILETETTTA